MELFFHGDEVREQVGEFFIVALLPSGGAAQVELCAVRMGDLDDITYREGRGEIIAVDALPFLLRFGEEFLRCVGDMERLLRQCFPSVVDGLDGQDEGASDAALDHPRGFLGAKGGVEIVGLLEQGDLSEHRCIGLGLGLVVIRRSPWLRRSYPQLRIRLRRMVDAVRLRLSTLRRSFAARTGSRLTSSRSKENLANARESWSWSSADGFMGWSWVELRRR